MAESILINTAQPELVHVELCGLDIKVLKDRRIIPQANNAPELVAQSAESTWLIHLLIKELIHRGVLKEFVPPVAEPVAEAAPAPVSALDAIDPGIAVDPSERETVRDPKV